MKSLFLLGLGTLVLSSTAFAEVSFQSNLMTQEGYIYETFAEWAYDSQSACHYALNTRMREF